MTTATARPVVTVRGRPRYEGSNICTWIGFKHVMYLVEEAVLDTLRQTGRSPQALFETYGLGVDIVDSDARILTALHIDDVVSTEVTEQPDDGSGELAFRTVTTVERDSAPVKAVTAKLRVVLRRAADAPEPPAELAGSTVPEIVRGAATDRAVAGGGAIDRSAAGGGSSDLLAGRGAVGPDDDVARLLAADGNAVVWRWRIPYFYCHFSERLQHSGYLRVMEEVVDLFLAERGISIRDMLDGRRWIPVVPQARVQILREALMEEELHTVFTVESIFKDLTYTARMDCYVVRDGQLVQTATGRITHGYAVVLDRHDWRVVPFDDRTMAALRGEHAGGTR